MAEDYLRVGTFGGSANEDFRGQGRYGFFWWFNEPMGDRGSPLPHLPEDAFYAMGHEGREVVLVLPEWNVVVAARGNWGGRDLEHTRLLISSLHRVERGRTERVSSTP